MQIEVNNQLVEASSGDTILDVLRRAGVEVPTLCHMERLLPSGTCRMCVVEVEGQESLVPSCSYPVAEGMKVTTHSPRAVHARTTIIELLLANHPDDCLYCVRNGTCQLQKLARQHGVRERRYAGNQRAPRIDISGPTLELDPAKCILCGKCVRVCGEVQSVAAIDFIGRGSETRVGTPFGAGLDVSSCVLCGQCVMVCPTAALAEQSHIKAVMSAIADPTTTVVVQHAPVVSVTVAEAFGLPLGEDHTGILTAALRRLGIDAVFDISFTADLAVIEQASELVARIRSGGVMPMMTGCSPAWIRFVSEFYPELLPNQSSCKSTQRMLGALLKSYWAERRELDPGRIFSVAITPCTAKKLEALRPDVRHSSPADIDAVLTTRELCQMITMHGVDLRALEAEPADDPFGERTTAGKPLGAAGGVMEATLRAVQYLITKQELAALRLESVRGLDGIKENRVRIGDLTLGVAVVSGLGNARTLLDEIRAGRDDLHFVEVMTCPGSCIAGGSQLIGASWAAIRGRMQALYGFDTRGTVRLSHCNQSVQRLYAEFLGVPLGEQSHHLLHTNHMERSLAR
jgi:iron-only hydrogenase group A